MSTRGVVMTGAILLFGAVQYGAHAAPPEGRTKSVTGCLQKGDEADEFSITGADGKKYGLRSSSVKLADHLGHKVTVTGKLKREENEENEKKEANPEVADINVTALKMISSSCP